MLYCRAQRETNDVKFHNVETVDFEVQKNPTAAKAVEATPHPTHSSNQTEEKSKEESNASRTTLQPQQQTDSSLYEMLQEYMVENETLRTENSDLTKHRERFKRDHEILARENEQLAHRIDELTNHLRMAKV